MEGNRGIDAAAKVRIIIGSVFLIVPMALFGWWTCVDSTTKGSMPDKAARFLAPMPGVLHSDMVLTLVAIGFSMMAVLLAASALRLPGGWRVFAIIVVVGAGLLTWWNLFTLM